LWNVGQKARKDDGDIVDVVLGVRLTGLSQQFSDLRLRRMILAGFFIGPSPTVKSRLVTV
jgi:hypothetical protein